MYRFHYDQTLDDEGSRQRETEKQAIQRSVELLRRAQYSGARSAEAVEALALVNRLWSYFLEELAKPENVLPVELRAKLISIGIWLIRESEAIIDLKSENFSGLISISEIVAEGLQ